MRPGSFLSSLYNFECVLNISGPQHLNWQVSTIAAHRGAVLQGAQICKAVVGKSRQRVPMGLLCRDSESRYIVSHVLKQ